MARTTIFLLPLLIAVLSPVCSGKDTLTSPNQLSAGKYLERGNYRFIMQPDCNLVLYDINRAIWSSGTHGQSTGCKLVMQSDGNLVIYTPSNRPLWATNTAGPWDRYRCVLQFDRNVVVYGASAIWSTGTNIKGTQGAELTQNFDAAAQLTITPAVMTNTTDGDVLKTVLIDAE